jgi:hypothetical protein
MLSWLKRKSPEEQAVEKNKVFEIELQSTVLNKKKKQKLKLALSTSTNAPNVINFTSSSPPQREARFAPTEHDGRKRTPAPCRIAGRTRIPDFQKNLDTRALQRLANSSSTGGIVVHKRRRFTNSEKRIICNFAAAFKSQKKALKFLQQKNLFIQPGQLSTWMKQYRQGVFNPNMTVPRTTKLGKKCKGPGGNMTKTDFAFEKVLTSRILLLRSLGAAIVNPRIQTLAFRIRDKEQSNRWASSNIMKCIFSNSWVTGFKNRNGLSTRKIQSKKKITDAKPEDIDAWLACYSQHLTGLFSCFWSSPDVWASVKDLVLALFMNTDETPLLFENVGDYTIDPSRRTTSQDQATVTEIANAKTQLTMVPSVSAAGDVLPNVYIVSGLTDRTLVNVACEFMQDGAVGLLVPNPDIPNNNNRALRASDYVHYEHAITLQWKTDKGTQKSAPIPYLLLASGAIVTIARKGWQTRQTFQLQLKRIITPHVNTKRSCIYSLLDAAVKRLHFRDDLSLSESEYQLMRYITDQSIPASLTYDNYAGHCGDDVDKTLAGVNIAGRPLLPNATKFIQIIDKVVNGPLKRALVTKHGTSMLDAFDSQLAMMDVPTAVLDDPEKAWAWTPDEQVAVEAPKRATVICWAEAVMDEKSSDSKFKASIKNGFVRYGQAPAILISTGKPMFFSFTESEDSSRRRYAAEFWGGKEAKQCKKRKAAEQKLEDEKLEIARFLSCSVSSLGLSKYDLTDDIM